VPALLEGGCRVTSLREGEADEHAGLRIFRHAGREWGAEAISLRPASCSRSKTRAPIP
jgi:hypothetical protein